jgi:hypothetical protein
VSLSLFTYQPRFLNLLTYFIESRVAESVRCLTADWTAGVRSPTEAGDFSFNLCVQTGSGAHLPSYTVRTGGEARPGRDADHSSSSSAEVKEK